MKKKAGYLRCLIALSFIIYAWLPFSVNAVDVDSDGISDNQDNCIDMANSNQHDSDSDGYGNACDADLDNDGNVNSADLDLFKTAFVTKSSGSHADFDSDGIVSFSDFYILKELFGKPLGPVGGASITDASNEDKNSKVIEFSGDKSNDFFSEKGLNGTTYYVSPNGNDDENNGTSLDGAFQTLQKASNETNPGDIVYVMNGTYENVGNKDLLHISRSGTENNWIMYSALPGHKPKLKISEGDAIGTWGAEYIVIQGFEIEGNNQEITLNYALDQQNNLSNRLTTSTGISIHKDNWGSNPNNYSHHIIIRNNHVHNFSASGISTSSADYLIIENNDVHNNAYYSPWATSGISIYKNFNFDNSDKVKIVIRNNISYANRNDVPFYAQQRITDGAGIVIDSNHEGVSLIGGVATNAAYTGRTLIEYNILYLNGGKGINIFRSDHVDIINNTSYQNLQKIDGLKIDISIGEVDDINLYNNIVYANIGTAIGGYFIGALIDIDNNLIYNSDTSISPTLNNLIELDPLFTMTSGLLEEYDFTLKANSPAIDTGIDRGQTRDFFGNPISGSPDIGAIEYQP